MKNLSIKSDGNKSSLLIEGAEDFVFLLFLHILFTHIGIQFKAIDSNDNKII